MDQVKHLVIEILGREGQTYRYFVSDYVSVSLSASDLRAQSLISKSLVLSQNHCAILQIVIEIDTDLPYQYEVHAVADVSFTDDELAFIIDSLLELPANVLQRDRIVICKEWNVDLQVHFEEEILGISPLGYIHFDDILYIMFLLRNETEIAQSLCTLLLLLGK